MLKGQEFLPLILVPCAIGAHEVVGSLPCRGHMLSPEEIKLQFIALSYMI